MFKRFFVFGSLVAALILLGCSGEKRPNGFPKIYSSSITVLDDSGPVEGVKITLFEKENNCPWPVGGTTGSSGKAELVTYGKFKGAPVGNFIVVLSKNEIEDADQMPNGNDDTAIDKSKPKKTSFRIFSLIDSKYSDRDTTPLTIKIDEGGANETFKLGKPIRQHIDTIRTDKPES